MQTDRTSIFCAGKVVVSMVRVYVPNVNSLQPSSQCEQLFFLIQEEQYIFPEDFADTNAYLLPVPRDLAQDLWMRDFTTINKDLPTHMK